MEKEKIPFMGISIDNLTIDEIIDSIFGGGSYEKSVIYWK